MIILDDDEGDERDKPETHPQKKPQVADMVKQAREKRRLLTRMASVPAQIQVIILKSSWFNLTLYLQTEARPAAHKQQSAL